MDRRGSIAPEHDAENRQESNGYPDLELHAGHMRLSSTVTRKRDMRRRGACMTGANGKKLYALQQYIISIL